MGAPADGGLDDQAALREQVERGQLLGQKQRVPSGAITAASAIRSVLVRAAIADASTSESGQGVAGSWFPGAA